MALRRDVNLETHKPLTFEAEKFRRGGGVIPVLFFFFFFFFFNSVLRPSQDYFSSYETGQSVGGRKRETPRKTTGHTRKQKVPYCLGCEYATEEYAFVHVLAQDK